MSDSISKAIVDLFETEMFYAEIISQMRRVVNPSLPAAAGVCIKNKIELHINLKGFDMNGEHIPGFDDVDPKTRVAILKHECEHILRGHISRMKEYAPEVFVNKDVADVIINQQKHMALNIAADCAINYGIPELNQGGYAYPKRFELQDGETFEWYMDQLKDNEKMKNVTHYDDHSLWKESEGAKEVVNEKIRQAVNKAAKNTRAAGKMTADQELIVQKFNEGHSVNWKQQLKRFIAHSVEVKIESSKKKRNRRYGILFPGEVKVEDLHIGVVTDSSGSVSDEAYSQFLNEIDNIAKYAKITMVDADCEVKNVQKYKKGMPRQRRGYGGTAYQPAFDYFNKDKTVDAVIYFGDMDSSDEPTKPKYPVLWSIVGSQEPPAKFGSKIYIKVGAE